MFLFQDAFPRSFRGAAVGLTIIAMIWCFLGIASIANNKESMNSVYGAALCQAIASAGNGALISCLVYDIAFLWSHFTNSSLLIILRANLQSVKLMKAEAEKLLGAGKDQAFFKSLGKEAQMLITHINGDDNRATPWEVLSASRRRIISWRSCTKVKDDGTKESVVTFKCECFLSETADLQAVYNFIASEEDETYTHVAVKESAFEELAKGAKQNIESAVVRVAESGRSVLRNMGGSTSSLRITGSSSKSLSSSKKIKPSEAVMEDKDW